MLSLELLAEDELCVSQFLLADAVAVEVQELHLALLIVSKRRTQTVTRTGLVGSAAPRDSVPVEVEHHEGLVLAQRNGEVTATLVLYVVEFE